MSSEKTAAHEVFFTSAWGCALLAGVLVAVFYGAALGFELVWDDQIWVNEFRRHDLLSLLKTNLTDHTLVSYYRPLVAAVLTLQLAVSQSPVFLHGLNLALHLLNLWLVIALARRTHSARPALLLPLAITVLAIHPILVEPVVWVSGRFDLFYTFFLLLSLLAATRIESPSRRFIAVTLAFFAALCCKESTLAYVAVGPLLVACMVRRASLHDRPAIATQAGWHGAALLTGCALYLSLRVGYLQLPLVKDTAFQVQTHNAAGEHLLLIARTLGTYLQMTLLPLWNLAPLHEMGSDPGAVYGYAGLGAVALVLAVAGLRWPALLPFSVWALALAPAANLVPLRLDLVQNRYLYFPIFAATLTALSGPGINHPAPRTRRWLWLLTALWLCALAVTNLSITRLWHDGVSLFSWAVTARPDSHFALENLALAHQTAGDFGQAIAVEKRIPERARSFQGRLLLARATRDQGDVADAVALFKEALATPAYDDAMQVSAIYELALVYRQLGDAQASAAQAAAAETLAKRQRVSARLCNYYRQALGEQR